MSDGIIITLITLGFGARSAGGGTLWKRIMDLDKANDELRLTFVSLQNDQKATQRDLAAEKRISARQQQEIDALRDENQILRSTLAALALLSAALGPPPTPAPFVVWLPLVLVPAVEPPPPTPASTWPPCVEWTPEPAPDQPLNGRCRLPETQLPTLGTPEP